MELKEIVAAERSRLSDLEKQLSDSKAKLKSATSSRESLKNEFNRIKNKGARPIADILKTDAKWILGAIGIAASGVGFVIGHAALGYKGAIIGVPGLGILVFALVARFGFNATLRDVKTIQEKGRIAVAEAKRLTEEVDQLSKMVPLARERVLESETALNEQLAAEKRRAPQGNAAIIVTPANAISSWETLEPTEKQLGFARSLGIRLRGHETRGEVSELIDDALDRQREQRAAPVPVVIHNNINIQQRSSRGVAILFNIFWPGIGQVYQGRALAGLFFMFATPIGYIFLLLPGMILHLICLLDAALYRQRY